MPITSTPPPARKTQAASAASKTAAVTRSSERAQAINGLGQIAQGLLVSTRQFADAGAVGMYFPAISAEVAKLADTDERIAKFIDPLLQVGPYTGLLTAVLPFVMQIMVNHGRGQAGTMGTVAPELLESQMKTAVMKATIQAKKEQAAAAAELKRMQTELAANVMENA